MDLIFPSGLRITLPEEAKEECELIKTVLELEEVTEIPISLPFELTDTYLKKYELSYDELSELKEEELSKWLEFKAFLGYCESGNHLSRRIHWRPHAVVRRKTWHFQRTTVHIRRQANA